MLPSWLTLHGEGDLRRVQDADWGVESESWGGKSGTYQLGETQQAVRKKTMVEQMDVQNAP